MRRTAINGFSSLGDVFGTIYKVKSWAFNAVAFLGVNLANLAGFIYAPVQLVYLLFSLMLVDWATGVYKAVKFRRFSSYTFQRMIWNLFFTFFLVGTSTVLAQHLAVFKLLHLADVMLTGFLVTYLVSIIENLREIDKRIIPDKIYYNLRLVLDLDKIINDFFRRDVTKEETAKAITQVVPAREVVGLLTSAAERAEEVAEAQGVDGEAPAEPDK